jgi:CDP-glycerol glycerophosphotransferase
MKIDKRNPRHWLLLLAQGLYSLTGTLVRALRPLPSRPLVVFYGHQYAGNIKALYDHWRALPDPGFDCACAFLDPGAAERAARDGISVLRCWRARDMARVARADIMVTDHGLHAMILLKRLTRIRFVDVWHGIPFKGFEPDDFTVQHDYDEVWVSSPLLQSLYVDTLDFPASIVKPLGYARADKLFRGDAPGNSFRADQGLADDRRIVLYAPTWEHDDHSRSQMPFGESYDSFYTRLGELCTRAGAVLVVRSHLNTSIEGGQYPGVIFCSMAQFPDTESLLQETDVLICDWSSIAFDFLATGRPTLFLDVKPPFKHGYTLGPNYRFGAIVDDLASLAQRLEQALSQPQHYWQEFAKTYAQVTEATYGQNTDGAVAQRQIEQLRAIIERDRRG